MTSAGRARGAPAPSSGPWRSRWLARRAPLLAVVALTLLLHLPMLLAPVGGFHAYNEGFYANRARIQATQPIWHTLVRPADLNNMPLFSWLLTLVVKLFGSAEWAIRLPSLVAALASVFLVGLLAEELAGPAAALPAALFLALMPVHLVVGNNAQPDMMMLALALGGVLAYVRAYRASDSRLSESGWRILSGVLLGLAALTKLNAVIYPAAIVCWETARRRDLKWLARRSAVEWAAAAASIPLVWVVIEETIGGGGLLGSQARIAGIAQAPTGGLLSLYTTEPLFQLGPLIALAALAGAVTFARKGRRPLALAVWMASLATLFFVFYHFHTYYLFPLAPPAAVLAASALDLAPAGERRRLLLAGIVALTLPLTLYSYNFKVGLSSIRDASSWMRHRQPSGAVILVPEALAANNGESLRYYLPSDTLLTSWPATSSAQPRFVAYQFAAVLPPDAVTRARNVVTMPVVLGTRIWPWFESQHRFQMTGFRFTRVAPYRTLGLYDTELPDFSVVDLTRLAPSEVASFKAVWTGQGR